MSGVLGLDWRQVDSHKSHRVPHFHSEGRLCLLPVESHTGDAGTDR